MTLRRALWASPLAVSVAVLVHVAAFGFLHAPGAGHASGLLSTLAVTLALGLFGAFGEGLAGARRPIATARPCAYAPLILAAAGAATFGLIELSEGHVALPALFQGALASLPIAYLVLRGARSARRIARTAGSLVAVFVARQIRAAVSGSFIRAARRPTFTSFVVRGTSRGRAPPVLT